VQTIESASLTAHCSRSKEAIVSVKVKGFLYHLLYGIKHPTIYEDTRKLAGISPRWNMMGYVHGLTTYSL